jgi:diphthamide synthase (EF-2-diphthine--ammonia ligase)
VLVVEMKKRALLFWGMLTEKLSKEMVNGGLRAMIACIDPKHLTADFTGQEYGESFLERIPADVDPCGENGEFHTFAFAGPMFKEPVKVAVGETVARDGFIFTDLLPA